MVRAEVVSHLRVWRESGYSELLSNRQRYQVLDIPALMDLLDIDDYAQLAMQRKAWIDQALAAGLGDDERVPRLSGGIAVGSYDFVASVQRGLGYSVMGRSIVELGGSCVLREDETCYDDILP